MVSKRIVFITNASEKDVLFKAKFSLVRLLHLACFKIDCLTPLDRALKEKGKLNMCTKLVFHCLVTAYVARLSLLN